MPRKLLRLTSSIGLALCVSFVFTPLGCGGSYEGSYQGSERVEPVRAAREEPQVSPGTFSAMMACVTEAKGRLTDTMYAVQFDVEVTERGEVGQVKLHDSYPSERALEECLGHALEGTTLPASVLRRLPKKAVSPASRGLTGQVWEEVLVVGGSTSLGPIALAAAGVTVLVYGGVLVTEKVIEAVRQRRKSKDQCADMYTDCISRNYSPCDKWFENTSELMCSVCQTNCIKGDPYHFTECTQCGFK